jgi:hypothetical protein
MISLNLKKDKGIQLASIFGCKLGYLPISYLGIPLH